MLDANYGGVVWTKHALERLLERGLSQGEVWRAFQHPTTSRWAKSHRGIRYIRVEGRRRVEVVAKKDPSGQWVILSCWSSGVGRDKGDRGWLGWWGKIWRKGWRRLLGD